MTSIVAVMASVVDTLNSIDTLLEALNGVEVYAYSDDATAHRSLSEAVDALPAGEMLVAYMGLGLGAREEITGWRHQVSLFWRPESEQQSQAIIDALVNGVPADSPVALPYARIAETLDPMDEITFSRAANADGIEYWTCTFGLAEVWN